MQGAVPSWSTGNKMHGRFLIEVRTTDHEIRNLSECINVGKFEVVCNAVKYLSGYDSQTGTW